MILVLVLLHFCNLLPVGTYYLGNRFPEAYEFLGVKNISNTNAARSEARYEFDADHVKEVVVPSAHPVIIETLPVGQGDATLIQCPPTLKKWFSLVDMGSLYWEKGAMTSKEYVSHINLLGGIGYKLKHIFLTHPDEDHLSYGYKRVDGIDQGLFPKLIEFPQEERITIHLSSDWENLPTQTVFLTNFLAYLRRYRSRFDWNYYDPNGKNVIDICGTLDGETTSSHQVTMNIIAAELGTEANEMSMVMSLSYQRRLDHNGGKMLFMGDFQGFEQYILLLKNEKYRQYLPADVVMVPHHGSDTEGNANPLFYDVVNAKHAIISSNIERSYKHPRLTTLASICNGFYMIDEEPYYPYGLCDANEICPWEDMAQGYGTTSNLNHPIYNGNIEGCRTKIHQTSKYFNYEQQDEFEDEHWKYYVDSFIVRTELYPDQEPEVGSWLWRRFVPEDLF